MRKAVFSLTVSTGLLITCLHDKGCTVTEGCAVAPPRAVDVDIRDETALVVWDAENQTEHFVRNANFETQAKDFGFLVPTPSVPSLHESGGRVLSALAERTVARNEYRYVEEKLFRLFKPGTGFDIFQSLSPDGAVRTDAMPVGAVQVIDQVTVAGYDATILKASDSQELLRWLGEHEYAARPELLEWLEAYTSQGWYITAFKVSQSEGNGGQAVARPVRMTFKTDRPFYPYREPADARSDQQAGKSRLLRLYVLADQKMDARIGETKTLPAKTVWADVLPENSAASLNRLLQGGQEPEEPVVNKSTLFLTEFEDHSSPRQGTDELYLTPAEDSSTVERPPIIHNRTKKIYGPDLHKWPFWLSAVVIVGVVWMKRRAAA